jgi:hypothetical protein
MKYIGILKFVLHLFEEREETGKRGPTACALCRSIQQGERETQAGEPEDVERAQNCVETA